MCRLFGFRSVIPSQVHRSLVAADNALGRQSVEHPDGWGVAYYVDGAPHVTRSPSHALSDALFHRVSGVVSSETVLAHVRKATQGPQTVLNCHPFQYGRWVFAHNGDLPRFHARWRRPLIDEVAPRLRRFILGETDSEVLFFVFLTRLTEHGPLDKPHTVDDVIDALARTMEEVTAICAPLEEGEKLLATCIVTDGTTMVAHHGGKELYWSSHKTRCADRDACPSLSPECEAPSGSGYVNHFIVSSEPLQGENVWNELSAGDLVGVDWRMRLRTRSRGRRQLEVVNG
ncbi:MAG: class II glutamine amidotransferase [Sandaracinaceae bacterium]|nr:class II glutamine amidotransferase [Sandaracinaceae bacterium]